MKKMNNKGFSLVELIIVIAIMAILVGVLAPQFIKYVEQSRESSDLQSIEEVKTAIDTVVADYGCTSSATVSTSGRNISYTLPADATVSDLSGYGVGTSGAIGTKTAMTDGITWTYQSFKWSCNKAVSTAINTGAYYDAYGNKL